MKIDPFYPKMALMVCALGLMPASPSQAATSRCALPSGGQNALPSRKIGTDDLLRLRDFGNMGTGNAPAPFAVSPDGNRLAVELRQASTDTDTYCTAIVIIRVKPESPPVVIDDGGDIVPASFSRYGMVGLPLGIPKTSLLRWSASGQHLAYTKEFSDHSEIWTYDLATHLPTRLVARANDISDLAWSSDEKFVLFSSQPDMAAALAKIASEGRSGYHYDGRFWPLASDHPMVSFPVPVRDQAVNIATQKVKSAEPEDHVPLHPASSRPPRGIAQSRSMDGALTAWTQPSSSAFGAPALLMVRDRRGPITCSWDMCRGIVGLWWKAGERTLTFQRKAGVADSETEFFSWRVGRGLPRLLLRTRDALFGCQPLDENLACGQETSISPRSIVILSTTNGQRRVFFDPNPEFRSLIPGGVRRLEWSNAMGIFTFGDLVLPPVHKAGTRLPLVIVQYDSRGFLRGGTGDEYPIQALAARGFAVLSFNRPPWYGYVSHAPDEHDFYRKNMIGWADRNSNLSSLQSVIEKLDREGLIDPKRVAITGQSDGAVTATFALANSNLFSAAILSTCCESATSLELAGKGLDDFYIAMGYPPNRKVSGDFWLKGSLMEAPAARPVPLLIQASSAEFRMGLATYHELHSRGWPIDMFVYPDEGHVKLHPAHRSTIYQRNIEWLTEQLHP